MSLVCGVGGGIYMEREEEIRLFGKAVERFYPPGTVAPSSRPHSSSRWSPHRGFSTGKPGQRLPRACLVTSGSQEFTRQAEAEPDRYSVPPSPHPTSALSPARPLGLSFPHFKAGSGQIRSLKNPNTQTHLEAGKGETSHKRSRKVPKAKLSLFVNN